MKLRKVQIKILVIFFVNRNNLPASRHRYFLPNVTAPVAIITENICTKMPKSSIYIRLRTGKTPKYKFLEIELASQTISNLFVAYFQK